MLRRANSHANASIERCYAGHTHKHIAVDDLIKNALGVGPVATAIDRNKIRRGRLRHEPIVLSDLREPPSSRRDPRNGLGQVILISKSCQRADLS